MAADMSLDRLLERIVEIARDLAGSRYAALGVLGDGPERLRTFITHGMAPAQVREIGDLPVGHGLLGLIIDRPEPLRLHDLTEHPASYGFPPNHPPMRSFLGVPVRIRDKVFGNLYLTEKVGGGDFTEQDERIVTALATAAGVAIENAELHEEAARQGALAGGDGGDHRPALPGDHGGRCTPDRRGPRTGAVRCGRRLGGLRAPRGRSGAPHRLGIAVDAESMARVQLEHSLASSVVRTGIPVAVEDLAQHPCGRRGQPAGFGGSGRSSSFP